MRKQISREEDLALDLQPTIRRLRHVKCRIMISAVVGIDHLLHLRYLHYRIEILGLLHNVNDLGLDRFTWRSGRQELQVCILEKFTECFDAAKVSGELGKMTPNTYCLTRSSYTRISSA